MKPIKILFIKLLQYHKSINSIQSNIQAKLIYSWHTNKYSYLKTNLIYFNRCIEELSRLNTSKYNTKTNYKRQFIFVKTTNN